MKYTNNNCFSLLYYNSILHLFALRCAKVTTFITKLHAHYGRLNEKRCKIDLIIST